MNVIYLILNLVQGITEFLPISSSGHLIILENVFRIDSGKFEAFFHLPTAIAIGLFFLPEWVNILKDKKNWARILIAAIPAGLIGLLLGNVIDAIFYSPIIIAVSQIFWGFWMTYQATRKQAEIGPKQENVTHKTDISKITLKQSLIIGLGQILALIPGTSRSGITTMTGIAAGVEAQTAAKFSFIVGFPIIGAASLVGIYKVFKDGALLSLGVDTWALVLGFAISLGIGLIAMKLFTSQKTLAVLKYSGIYRIIIGVVILLCLI